MDASDNELDLTGAVPNIGNRSALLNELRLLGDGVVSARTAAFTLKEIADAAGKRPVCFMKQETLADRLYVSRKQVKRALNYLVGLGVLSVWRQQPKGEDAASGQTHYAVRWDTVRARVDAAKSPGPMGQFVPSNGTIETDQRDSTDRPTGQYSPTNGTVETDQRDSTDRGTIYPPVLTGITGSTTPSEAEPSAWQSLHRRLVAAQVVVVGELIRGLKERGVAPEEALRAVAFWESRPELQQGRLVTVLRNFEVGHVGDDPALWGLEATETPEQTARRESEERAARIARLDTAIAALPDAAVVTAAEAAMPDVVGRLRTFCELAAKILGWSDEEARHRRESAEAAERTYKLGGKSAKPPSPSTRTIDNVRASGPAIADLAKTVRKCEELRSALRRYAADVPGETAEVSA